MHQKYKDVRENEVIGGGNCLSVWSAPGWRHSCTTGRGCGEPGSRAAPYPRVPFRMVRSRWLWTVSYMF